MTSYDLQYAYLLASTLMWKRFGDEKPELNNNAPILVKTNSFAPHVVRFRGGRECFKPFWAVIHGEDYNLECEDSHLWLYLSDLDVLRVKG